MTATYRSIALDLSGLKCPLPVLRTRKALRRLNPGDVLIVTCTDPLAGIDIPHLLRETGDALVRQTASEHALIFEIRKNVSMTGAGTETAPPFKSECEPLP
ncbi:sulfurtransferase TusA family protein [Beijerinckia indica]|uniref:SirA family protein n=1 Tax=Beijerinckia indica subsp. indica (strain ATCC 9039 / DSM 1715 / NCIMB 8712) TaxID=395963 RepID=B2IFI0_BEII9|nr:sulfurtransferase TusA family protein [Beijerinckia indica]ACB97105.1 SirA family protein [Beijerinckia indica subsp. indica ATCC 9039]